MDTECELAVPLTTYVLWLVPDHYNQGVNHWQWVKVLDAGKNDGQAVDEEVCLAYTRDRIAVSFPRTGVKIWVWSKGASYVFSEKIADRVLTDVMLY